MRKFILFSFVLLLSGCNNDANESLDFIFGRKTNTVVLVNKPITIGKKAMHFDTNKKAKIISSNSAVCVSLRGNFPLAPVEKMDKEYERLTNGTQIYAKVYTESGSIIEVNGHMQAWKKYGVIEKNDELSACLNLNCKKEKLSNGAIVNSIEISADKPIEVKGLYWTSSNE